jgi:hypothetical protein
MVNSLEGYQQYQQLNRPLAAIPWPYNEYLGGICNEGYQTQHQADGDTTKDVVHSLLLLVVVARL